ncbi:unnamed protein product [Spirodela intermedia]|uniref:Uncharacterized protein n=1 Tax=Spirodela intermedia TaxID=51605 RepID=A0A7I8JRX4_SPIIN|nr:unnamed protein product [Spirodela intermedia]CAA6672874.1 unnamed protein product [Spirodela intermedia]
MENLENLTNLEELWLGRTASRQILKFPIWKGFGPPASCSQDCVALEELYLSHNGITRMEGLSSLENLRVLDISNNKLTLVEGISDLTRLEDLWLNDNQIPSLEGLDAAVSGSREKLTTLYLENNPCSRQTTPLHLSLSLFNGASVGERVRG